MNYIRGKSKGKGNFSKKEKGRSDSFIGKWIVEVLLNI